VNLFDTLAKKTAVAITKPYVTVEGVSYSFAAILQRAVSTAVRLRGSGIAEDDRVAILAPNCVEYVIVLFALWRIGATPVLLNTRAHEREIVSLLERCECRLIVTSDVESMGFDVPCDKVHLGKLAGNAPAETGSEAPPPAADSAGEALIIMTSGSSGDAKGVRLTAENLYYNALGANDTLGLSSDDCWLLSLPFFHVGGIGIMLRTLLAGARMVIPASNQPPDILATIRKDGVTYVSVVPTMLKQLLAADTSSLLKSLRVIMLSGAPPDPALLRKCLELELPVVRSYGLSEAASQVTLGTTSLFAGNPDSSGKVHRHCELSISGEGEIRIRGKTLFAGYVGGEERGSIADWYATGDLGSVDPDGDLFVLGRKDEMIISGGENIYPYEIERALSELNSKLEVKVVGVPNEKWGQRPIAFVIGDDSVDVSALRSALSDRLARFKLPDQIIPLKEWPLTSTGKIDTGALRRLYPLR